MSERSPWVERSNLTPGGFRRPLTPTQLRVCAMLARGWTQSEAASRLGMADATIKRHILDARMRLDVPVGMSILAVFDKLGWLQVPEQPAVPYAVTYLVDAIEHAEQVLAELRAA